MGDNCFDAIYWCSTTVSSDKIFFDFFTKGDLQIDVEYLLIAHHTVKSTHANLTTITAIAAALSSIVI